MHLHIRAIVFFLGDTHEPHGEVLLALVEQPVAHGGLGSVTFRHARVRHGEVFGVGVYDVVNKGSVDENEAEFHTGVDGQEFPGHHFFFGGAGARC